jgi:hypothetical protein
MGVHNYAHMLPLESFIWHPYCVPYRPQTGDFRLNDNTVLEDMSTPCLNSQPYLRMLKPPRYVFLKDRH